MTPSNEIETQPGNGKQSSPRRLRFAMAAVLACLAQCVSSCSMPQLTQVSEERFPQASECQKCHVEIAREWAASSHANAFRNPRYREACDNYQSTDCLGCHAPQPTYSTSRPAVRRLAREEGVTCVCCHLEEGKMVGPTSPTGLACPHPVGVSADRFRNANFCGRCHEGAFSEWKASKLSPKPQCQQCHMPQVTRKMTQATNIISESIVASEKAGEGRRHSFDLVPSLKDTLPAAVSVSRQGGQWELTLRNLLPHNLPTGDYGSRVILVTAEAVDAGGRAAPCGRWELNSADEDAIASLGQKKWKINPPAGTKAIRVRLVRSAGDGTNTATLMETQAKLP